MRHPIRFIFLQFLLQGARLCASVVLYFAWRTGDWACRMCPEHDSSPWRGLLMSNIGYWNGSADNINRHDLRFLRSKTALGKDIGQRVLRWRDECVHSLHHEGYVLRARRLASLNQLTCTRETSSSNLDLDVTMLLIHGLNFFLAVCSNSWFSEK